MGALAALASPSYARDKQFSGARAEAHLGLDHADADFDAGGGRKSGDGLLYGGAVGYDLALDRFVVGPELCLDFITTKIATTRPIGSFATFGREVGASLRMGYAVRDRILVYGRVGYLNTRQTRQILTFSSKTREEAPSFGGGIESVLTGRVYGKVEYRYADLSAGTEKHQVIGGVGIRF